MQQVRDMTDLSRQIDQRAESDLCARHAEMFDEGELIALQVIAARLDRGSKLTMSQCELLARCAEKARQSAGGNRESGRNAAPDSFRPHKKRRPIG